MHAEPARAPGAGRARARACTTPTRRPRARSATARRAAPPASRSCSRARRRRGRDLLEHRDPRRPDRRGRAGRQGDLLREADVARPRRGRPRAGRRGRRPACRSRSASTAASTPRTRRSATRSPRRRSASRTSCGSRAATPSRRRSSTCAGPGGIFLDMTIHDFDMARFVTGSEVVEVFARGAVRIDPAFAEADDVDTALVTLVHESGCLTAIDNSRRAVYGYDQRVEVFGSRGDGGVREPARAHGASCGPPRDAHGAAAALLPRALHAELRARVGGVRAGGRDRRRRRSSGPPTPARRW